MAHETQAESYIFSGRAASAIQPYGVLSFPVGSGIDYGLVPAAAGASGVSFGVSRASHAVGDAAECITYGEAKVRALASLGAGAIVGAGAAGSIGVLPVAAPSGPTVTSSVGVAVQNAVLNDIFTILVRPLSN
ncbi:MAG TPA: hypothetical protein VNN25_18530 [Thermoanaerobaculia bacterium]|nr:hypothetical protein [Thermoanaerobaculia bacterium]